MMKAIVCTQYRSPDVLQLQQVDKPVPRNYEVLVNVHAASVTATRDGAQTGKPVIVRLPSGLTKPKNSILGLEFAGEIAAIGKDVTAFEVGDPVFGMTGATTPGAYAEFKCMPEDGVMLPKPDNISYGEAAAIIEGSLTALNFLHNNANIQQGQKALIYGASGSVGTASIQIAKYFGADVTAVCSSANFELVRSIGADSVIDYRKDGFTKNGQQYDVIFDTLGKRMFWINVFGRKKAIFAANYARSASEIKEDLAVLKELIEAGKIQAVIDRYYPLEKTVDAHRYVETGRKKGNVVITIDHNDTSSRSELGLTLPRQVIS